MAAPLGHSTAGPPSCVPSDRQALSGPTGGEA
jgi:hypothetical protein